MFESETVMYFSALLAFVSIFQTCIAPDYVLISKKRQKEFLDIASQLLAEWTQKGVEKDSGKFRPFCPVTQILICRCFIIEKNDLYTDITRIINQRHFQRVKKIIDTTKGRIAVGGQSDEKSLWISPALVGKLLFRISHLINLHLVTNHPIFVFNS